MIFFGLVSWSLVDFVWRISYLVGAVVVMVMLNPRLAAMVLSILPLLAILFAIFQKKLIRINRQVREVNSRITGNFNEGITGAKTIKSLAVEGKRKTAFTQKRQQCERKVYRLHGLADCFPVL